MVIVNDGQRGRLAADLAVGDQAPDLAAEGGVHGAGRASRLGHALKEVDDEERGLDVGYRRGLNPDPDFHARKATISSLQFPGPLASSSACSRLRPVRAVSLGS